MIYADNAATTKLDADAFEAMRPFLLEEYGNASQPYSFSRSAKKALRDARSTIASCIGALDEEIYFTSGGTESDNWAIKGLMRPGDTRLTIASQIEHKMEEKMSRTMELNTIKVQALKELNYTKITDENASEVLAKIAEIQSRKIS